MHSLKTFTTSLRLRNYISSTTKVVPLLLTEQGQRHSSPLGQVKTFRTGAYLCYQ
jgi:hypothetical protein